jgi:hypothetical protein
MPAMRHALGSLTALLIFAAGCDDKTAELSPVSGHVTYDGKPLAGARLMFQPEAADGSPSYGTADAQGRYELGFKRGVKGALPGWHRVRIDAGSGAGGPKRLPARYSAESELREEVKAGEDNEIDFDLKSDAG